MFKEDLKIGWSEIRIFFCSNRICVQFTPLVGRTDGRVRRQLFPKNVIFIITIVIHTVSRVALIIIIIVYYNTIYYHHTTVFNRIGENAFFANPLRFRPLIFREKLNRIILTPESPPPPSPQLLPSPHRQNVIIVLSRALTAAAPRTPSSSLPPRVLPAFYRLNVRVLIIAYFLFDSSQATFRFFSPTFRPVERSENSRVPTVSAVGFRGAMVYEYLQLPSEKRNP